MTIHDLIKKAIENQDIRSKLFTDAIETCKEFGIPVDPLLRDSSIPNLKSDPSILQGGYRP